MANLSNINNVLRVSSNLRVGINTDAASYALEIGGTNSGIKLKNSGGSGKVYSILSDTSGNFQIYDDAAASGRLVINSAGNTTFAGTVTGSEFYGGGLGLTDVNATYLKVDTAVSSTGLTGERYLSKSVYQTSGITGFLIRTNIASNNYAMWYAKIQLEEFNYNTTQVIEVSGTALSSGGFATKSAVSYTPITIKAFNYDNKVYFWVPALHTYTDCNVFVKTGRGYVGSTGAYNRVDSITASAIPSTGVTNSVDIVASTLNPGDNFWSANGNDIYNSNSGNVTVSGDLSVGGANKARFKSDGTNTYVDAIPANSEIRFRVAGAVEKFRIAASGATTQTMDSTTSLSHLWSQGVPLQNVWYTVYTYSQYDSVCFFAMVSFENDAGDGANQSAMFATSAGPAYGAAFGVQQISGGTGIEARRSSTSFQVRQTIGGYTSSTRLNVRFVSIN